MRERGMSCPTSGKDRVRPRRLRHGLSALLLLAIGSAAIDLARAEEDRGASEQGLPAESGVPELIQPEAAAPEALAPEIRDTLSRFGTFVVDQTYGEVWMPTVTPKGWHPYPPCRWIKAKRWGLYYDDRTEWGRIVHHFGRWIHNGERGWMWVPGTTFSPAWVVWRSSPAWTGWAPLPPIGPDDSAAADAMAGSDSWLFQESALLLAGCADDKVAAPTQISALLPQTPYITRVGFWSDAAVLIVPTWIVGPYVQIDLSFRPWSPGITAIIANDWNWVWHHTTINNAKNVCLRKSPKGI